MKLMFVPPPMEGTISLGIYDENGKLVRVLHREAGADEFVAALDGFITFWDGMDDAGHALPPGHYSASGYMVGAVAVRPAPAPSPAASGSNAATTSPSPTPAPPVPDSLASALPTLNFPNGKPFVPQDKIHVGLVGNPLDRDRAGSAELSVALDPKGSWLELFDGLPLKQISQTPNLKWTAFGRSAPGDPLVVFQSDGKMLQEFLITRISNMVAFDCGDFELTGTSN